MIDADRLLAFLTDRAQAPSPIVHAIYRGLADRIARGDFNTEEVAD